VQVIPHVTDVIKGRIRELSDESKYDVVITEIGGTTGDIEGLQFLEAIRQFILEVGPENVINMHVTLVPYIKAAHELKTKPTQQSVAKLREIGLQPEVLICRAEQPLDRVVTPSKRVKIAVVGKYMDVRDAYKSIYESLTHAAASEDCGIDLKLIDAESLEHGVDAQLKDVAGVLIPGGFGVRGVEGKINAARFAREREVPFLGLCLGMHVSTIEFARNVCVIKN